MLILRTPFVIGLVVLGTLAIQNNVIAMDPREDLYYKQGSYVPPQSSISHYTPQQRMSDQEANARNESFRAYMGTNMSGLEAHGSNAPPAMDSLNNAYKAYQQHKQ